MLTKGIIIGKSNKLNKYFVRIPIFESAGIKETTNSLDTSVFEATVCIADGVFVEYKKNDIIYVMFEDNDYAKPVIIGKLFLATQKKKSNSFINADSIEIKGKSVFSTSTSFGQDLDVNKLIDLIKDQSNINTKIQTLEENSFFTFFNIKIPINGFELESSPTYASFPYKATIEISDKIFPSMLALVLWSSQQSLSGKFFSNAIVNTHTLSFFSTETNSAEITIPGIIIIRNQ